MARRNLAHVKAGTVDRADGVARIPAENYFAPERFERERQRIFARVPLVLGLSAELREPGDYKAMIVSDVPVLLVRGEDGRVCAFLNACSHRGAIVVPEGCGQAQRFTCPYHAWTYDSAGKLVAITRAEDFGEVDVSRLGLTPLPVAERSGLVFGVLTPGQCVDFDAFLAGYAEVLALLRLDECAVVGEQVVEGPNWKVAYDGYLDFYHLPYLHRDSFGPRTPSTAIYDAWGPHQRVSMPNPRYLELESQPEAEWNSDDLLSGVWTVFPHVSIADFDAGGKLYMVSRLFPGESARESLTVQTFLAVGEVDAKRQEAIDGMIRFLEHVVRDEDYFTGKRIQNALKAGAKPDVLFGRNEGGCQDFHRWVDAVLQADDENLPGLFRDGP